MTLLQDIKKSAERITGWQRPKRKELAELIKARKPATFRFRDDGKIPNNPYWPLVVYRAAVQLPKRFDPAAIFEDIFGSNGWGDSWRGEIYKYLHYHSRIHEVLGVARGSARVRFGGKKGRTLRIKAGDAVILPAGTGHQCLNASRDFMAVGAYPPSGTYDECGPRLAEHDRGMRAVRRVRRPRKDPLFGSKGPLLSIWSPKR